MALPANWVGGHRVPASPEGQREESGRSAGEGLEAVGVRGGAERGPGVTAGLRPAGGPTAVVGGGEGRGLGPQLGAGGGSLPETRALPPPRRAEGLKA